MRGLAIVIGVLLTPAWTIAQSAQPLPATPRAPLSRTVAEVRFDAAPLEDVLEWFADASGQNVVVQWQLLADVGVERDQPVSLRLRNVQLGTVLWLVLNQVAGPDIQLAYQADREVLLISTAQALSQHMIVRVYDVTDLLSRAPHFRNAYRLDLSTVGTDSGSAGLEGGDEGDDQPTTSAAADTMGALVNVIQEAIEPDSWRANGGNGTVVPFGTQLVVRNTTAVHQQLGGGAAP